MVERAHENDSQYFISMTDMLLGLLVIFLIIVAYLVLSFSQSLEKARSADEAVRKAELALQAAEEARLAEAAANAAATQANARAEEAEQRGAAANAAAAQANARAEEAEQRADELQNILLSIDQTRIEILKQIKARLAASNFNVQIDEKTGVVRLPEAELFETARFNLTEQGRRNMLILRDALEEILPCYASSKKTFATDAKDNRNSTASNLLTRIKRASICQGSSNNYVDAFFVEGHADSQPVKSNILFKDNQELSTKRAMNAYNLLFASRMLSSLTNSNDEYIMSVSGYGSNRPLCLEKTKSCFAKNRRIDLRLVMEVPRALIGKTKID